MSTKYAVKIRQCRIQNCFDKPSDNRVGVISPGSLFLTVGNWSVKCDLSKGRLTVCHTNPASGTTRTLRKPSKLRDGTLYLQEDDQGGLHASVDALNIRGALSLDFGITNSINLNPNRDFTGYLCQYPRDGEDYGFFRVLTDGNVEIETSDDPDYNFDPDEPNSLMYYRGQITYRVTDATWAVICEASLDEFETLANPSVTLYTRAKNKYLLLLELDDYLTQHDLGNFADYIGDFVSAL